jgi:hypothetical protein
MASAPHVAYGQPDTLAVVNGTEFDFMGAFLHSAWHDNLSLTVTGVLGGTTLYEETLLLDYDDPATFYTFNFFGIDELRLLSSGGTDANAFDNGSGSHFALDNFTFNEASPVPEPASVVLLGTGAAALARRRYRRRRE